MAPLVWVVMRITVVGSINLDLVASAARLPMPGETITGGTFFQAPGGKGANQALAARRLGAEVTLVGRVGDDANAVAALALLAEEGVDVSGVERSSTSPTGVAVILVGEGGENQIVVAPGANRELTPRPTMGEAVICQLEIPIETVAGIAEAVNGMFVVNAAPARPLPEVVWERADLLVLNRSEADFYGEGLGRARGLVAITLGADGAVLKRGEVELAAVSPPRVTAVDTVGAGDCFVAALTVGMLQGRPPEEALRFAVTAGALATTRPGAQPAMPSRAEVLTAME